MKFYVKLNKITIETNKMTKKCRMNWKKFTKSEDSPILKFKNENIVYCFL